jgi:hypothetical protein
MAFKNDFERDCFEAARAALRGTASELLHNRVLIADYIPGTGVISFTGSPKKEIDVLVAKLTDNTSLLISAKDYKIAAPPAVVQEWAAVVRTMSSHSTGTSYLGLVVAAHGFSEGCAAWAIDYNLGLVPPFKGKPIAYRPDTVFAMLQRATLTASSLLRSGHQLLENRNFYWSIYKSLADFPENDPDHG